MEGKSYKVMMFDMRKLKWKKPLVTVIYPYDWAVASYKSFSVDSWKIEGEDIDRHLIIFRSAPPPLDYHFGHLRYPRKTDANS
jgi:hypothetical protein